MFISILYLFICLLFSQAETLPVDRVRQLPKKYQELPPQAIESKKINVKCQYIRK
jgi:hypothetical protein